MAGSAALVVGVLATQRGSLPRTLGSPAESLTACLAAR